MVKKKQQRARDRRRPDRAAPPPPAMAVVTSATASGGSQVTIVFDQSVNIAGNNLPATWRFGTGNRTVTALVSTTGTSYVFTVSGTVASTQVYAMPANDPAARTDSGGYVAGQNGLLA